VAEEVNMLEAALSYARRGWPVIPLFPVRGEHKTSLQCACGVHNCKSAGKHPHRMLVPHGRKDATTDEATIRRWWATVPDANIGIILGRASGLIALDVDPRHGGDFSLRDLEREHGELPPTMHSLTGGGGDHWFFRYPEGVELRSLKLAQGIDLQAEGAYVVAPPSLHASSFRYDWEVQGDPADVPPAALPDWLLEMAQNRMQAQTELEAAAEATVTGPEPPVRLAAWGMALWEGRRVIDATDGQEKELPEAQSIDRSETLFHIGRALRAAGATTSLIAAALAERDQALGYNKYSGRRNGQAEIEYKRIAAKVSNTWTIEGLPTVTVGGSQSKDAEPVTPETDEDPPMPPEPAERWVIVPASQIDPNGDHVNWIWEGYLASGAVTELVGLWKSGKTTLLTHLVKAMERGGMFCGMPLARGKVLIITEEHSSLWAERRDELDLSDNVHFIFRPFLGRPDLRTWRQFMRFVADAVIANGYDLVILDPLSSQAPIEDENDSAMMTTVIVEFHRITEAGASLLVAHHPSKAPMGQGRSSRGSGALPGFVDIILEFGRYQAEEPEDTRRVLLGLSRFKETPAEVVIGLGDEGYTVRGTKAQATVADRQRVILSLLSKVPVTSKAIRQSWPADSAVPLPGIRSIEYDLKGLIAIGKVRQEGAGTRNSPFLYSKVGEGE